MQVLPPLVSASSEVAVSETGTRWLGLIDPPRSLLLFDVAWKALAEKFGDGNRFAPMSVSANDAAGAVIHALLTWTEDHIEPCRHVPRLTEDGESWYSPLTKLPGEKCAYCDGGGHELPERLVSMPTFREYMRTHEWGTWRPK